MKVFASCSSYVLGALTSPQQATELITRAVADETHKQVIPAVHALRELRYLAEVALRVDGGATHIGKSRSRHFAAALESDADVWFYIADDTDTTAETLAFLLDAVDREEPSFCIAPCILRGGTGVVSVEWSPVIYTRPLANGGRVRRAVRGDGIGAMNRAALVAIAKNAPTWRDDVDGVLKPAPYAEILEPGGAWLGEDMSLCRRLEGVELEGLVTGETTHNNLRLRLEDVP
jgi:hypothetical protein